MANRPRSAVSWSGSNKFYNPYIGKGLVLFTGPDGTRDHNITVIDPTYVGIGTMSPQGTSDLNYLWRSSKSCPHPLPKNQRVGEIGWGLKYYRDLKNIGSGHQIERGEFRQECEDRHTHLYLNPWYPKYHEKKVKQLTHTNLQNYDKLDSRPNTAPTESIRFATSSLHQEKSRAQSATSQTDSHHTRSSSGHSNQLDQQICQPIL